MRLYTEYNYHRKRIEELDRLSQFDCICEQIPKIKYNNLMNVTLEEFNEKCKQE